jgi:transketolase
MADDAALEELGINVIRGLAMDAPQKANSGHPGTAMALAPLAHVLFTRIMRHDPSQPGWPDRDRFVLSAGHASILLYSMLFLTGYGLELEDLKNFRQWASRTPGHPEHLETPGVEVTTGPLGQGFANAVGLGLAERWLRARFGGDLVDHYTFVVCSDGDLEEGISHEAASLAGHLGLGKLVYVYDDNHISIDGPTELAFTEDVPRRFEAYGWHTEAIGEVANDTDALEAAIRRAMAEEDRPSLIVLRSHIGWPSPNKTDSAEAHGDPLGPDEIRATKDILGLPADESFWVPDEVLEFYRRSADRGRAARTEWEKRFERWSGDRAAWDACQSGRAMAGWERKLPAFEPGDSIPTRRAINQCIDATSDLIPGLLVGAGDLTGNTGVKLKGATDQSVEHPEGSQVHYGVREHAMAGVMNGLALHGGVLPVGGTFFIFSDYMRPSVRLAALSKAHVVYSWTHDSVGLGEDGPTHQPVEQLAAMRAVPGLRVIRPADANECAHAWRIAVDSEGPTGLVLSRQSIPVLDGTAESFEGVSRGGYVLVEPPGENPDVVLIGTGSEVQLCVAAAALLSAGDPATASGSHQVSTSGQDLSPLRARVVSLPCWDLFEAQDARYRHSVLPPDVPTLAVEAASSFGWDRYADETVGIDRFGASAPGPQVLEHLGFTAENVAAHARALCARARTNSGGKERR